MGMVIRFPGAARGSEPRQVEGGSAAIVILPVVRIERYGERPTDDGATATPSKPRKPRRRRTARS